jgi:hypothetical protein
MPYSGALFGRGLEPFLHLMVINQPCLLEDRFAAREDEEVGDASDLVAGGELWVGFGIHFEHDGFAGHVSGGLGYLRGGHAAWSTPLCPEVDKDRDGRVLEDLVKEGRVDREWLGERRQLGLASSAATGSAEVFGGDTILLLALGAGANDGHGGSRFLDLDSWI